MTIHYIWGVGWGLSWPIQIHLGVYEGVCAHGGGGGENKASSLVLYHNSQVRVVSVGLWDCQRLCGLLSKKNALVQRYSP